MKRARSEIGQWLALTGLAAVWCIAMWGVSSLLPVHAAPLALPPLVEPAGTERHPGKVIWSDLVTPDLAGAKRFYGGLFGWTFRDLDVPGLDYTLAMLDGAPVAGLVQRTPRSGEQRQPAWLTFLSVADVDAALVVARGKGARVLAGPHSYAQRGRQVVLADPQGAVFALLQSFSGDPPDTLAAPGERIWSSLLTSDPDRDVAFYQSVVGYDVFDQTGADGIEHMLLASDDYARASANGLPPTMRPGDRPLRPHWLNFVRVLDTADAVARAVALGGRVLVAPHMDRHGGAVAVLADPAGAPFGLMEWTLGDATEVGK